MAGGFRNPKQAGSSFTAAEILWVQTGDAGVLLLTYQGSAPSATAGVGKVYVKNSDGHLYYLNGSGLEVQIDGGGTGTVTSVTGTANRITSTGGTTPVIDIAATFEALLGKVGSPLSQFAATTSAQLAGVISDETGSGALVFANSPTLVTPALGTPTALVGTNITGTASGLSIGGNAATATALQTGRTISISGDLSYTSPSFDGSGNVTAAGTLATVNSNVGSFTYSSITVNGKGLITAAASGTAPLTSVSGTVNRITSSGGATPTIDISASYVGQASITTVGTLSSGAIPASLITAGTFGSGAYSFGTGNSVTLGTIELGAASDTTLSRSGAGVLAVEGVDIPSVSSTNTLTNKRITRRTALTNAPGATPTTNSDAVDLQIFTGLGANITSMTTNLSGTATEGQFLEFRLTDGGTARTIAWGASFVASGTIGLPTTTVISVTLRVLFEWNGANWACVGVV